MRLNDAVTASGDRSATALVFEDEVLSFGALANLIDTDAARFRTAGIRPLDKVVLALPNGPLYPIALLALDRIGAIAVPLNPGLTEMERAPIFQIARPQFTVSLDASTRQGLTVVPTGLSHYFQDDELNGLAAILFTSGTTGAPKGVMMTAESLLVNAIAVRDYLELTPADKTLIFLPLYYCYSLSQLLSTWLGGGAVVLMKNLLYPAEAFQLCDRWQATGFGGVPTSLRILADHARNRGVLFESVRYVLNAGGPLPPSTAKSLQEVCPSAAVFNNYGCTEIGPRATAVSYRAFPERLGSIGRAIRDVDLHLVRDDLSLAGVGETGEIVLGGPTLMRGYYRDRDATGRKMSRWGFHTGDFAYADAGGFLYYEGRSDDVFKCAGEKVSAKEVEDVVLEHAGILEAAVTAQEDPLLGHVPVVHVVTRAEGAPTEEELRVFCGCRLSRHKIPRRVFFVPALDKTPTGKIRKFRLREREAVR